MLRITTLITLALIAIALPVAANESSKVIFTTGFGYLAKYSLPNFTKVSLASVGSFQPTTFAGVYDNAIYLRAADRGGLRVLVKVPISTFKPEVVRTFEGQGDIKVNEFGFTADANWMTDKLRVYDATQSLILDKKVDKLIGVSVANDGNWIVVSNHGYKVYGYETGKALLTVQLNDVLKVVADQSGSVAGLDSSLMLQSAHTKLTINTPGHLSALLLQKDSIWSAASAEPTCESPKSVISHRNREGRLLSEITLDRKGSVYQMSIDRDGSVWVVMGECTGIALGRSYVIRIDSRLKHAQTMYAGGNPIQEVIFSNTRP